MFHRLANFPPSPPVVCGVRLELASWDLFDNLIRVKSPLCDLKEFWKKGELDMSVLRMVAEMWVDRDRTKEIDPTEFSFAASVFIFLTPQQRVRELIEAGETTFREAVAAEITGSFDPAALKEILMAATGYLLDVLIAFGGAL
jgi:hypothetical protein